MLFYFEKLPLVVMVEHYEVWVILGHVYELFAGFPSIDSVLDDTSIYHQFFCLVFETKHFSLPILFFQFLNKHDPLCIHELLTTVLIAQDGY